MRWSWLAAVCLLSVGFVRPGPDDSALRTSVAEWHRAGHRGHGVTVAVLDTGFRGYRSAIDRVLPANTFVRSFRIDGNLEARDSDHGLLCADIVNAIAPDARLLLLNWQPGDPASFVAAVTHAQKAGARIVTCSVAMPCWSDGEGGGPVHAGLREMAEEVLLVASAGNLAERHWSGRCAPDSEGWHRWPGGTNQNAVTPFDSEPVSIELTSAGGMWEIVVVNQRDTVVTRTQGQGSAIARFTPRTGVEYSIRIRGDADREFHVSALGGWLKHPSARSSIPFPGDGAEWMTVGAWEKGRRAGYSSCGPCGNSTKPDAVAPVPFPSRLRTTPFGGTSAAAPQAAGLAALIWSRHPSLSVREVREIINNSACDVLTPGVDCESGRGVLRLPAITVPDR